MKKYFGDKAFYLMVLAVAFPIMIQNGITNFVGLLDNLMVGQLGTEAMSGVAIVNQFQMVYGICIFGVVSGASIFGTQFFGKGEHENLRSTFQFKMIVSIFVAIIWMLVFTIGGKELVNLYLSDDGQSDIVLTYKCAHNYLMIMLIGMIPFAISQVYASTLRETGQTIVPMIGSSAAVVTNCFLNYLLIFGNFGAPKLGVAGAAIATVTSRYIEFFIVVIWTHLNCAKEKFIIGAYTRCTITKNLIFQILKTGTPLFLNETLWSVGQAAIVQCYSTRGLNAVAALNISTTVANLFNVVFISLGNSVGIIVGQLLGADKKEKAVDTDRKLIVFSLLSGIVIGAIMFVLAPFIPEIYNTNNTVKVLATHILKVGAVFMPVYAFYHAAYFTLRTGGKTVITFLFDSCYLLLVNLSLAFLLTSYTKIPVVEIYIIVQLAESLKCIVGYILLKKRVWVNNLVNKL